MITYKIKETEAKDTDPMETVIVKTGGEVEFTLAGVNADIIYLQKMKKELLAKKGIEEAKKVNVLGTHPHIEQMSEEDRVACYLYQEAFAFCKVAENKIKEIDEQIAEYEKEKEEIKNQTGLSEPVKEDNEQKGEN